MIINLHFFCDVEGGDDVWLRRHEVFELWQRNVHPRIISLHSFISLYFLVLSIQEKVILNGVLHLNVKSLFGVSPCLVLCNSRKAFYWVEVSVLAWWDSSVALPCVFRAWDETHYRRLPFIKFKMDEDRVFYVLHGLYFLDLKVQLSPSFAYPTMSRPQQTWMLRVRTVDH